MSKIAYQVSSACPVDSVAVTRSGTARAMGATIEISWQ